VTLGPKETKTVTMHVAPRAFEAWSAAENKWVRFGARKVEVGGSERELKGSAAAE
jgi:hypothetical protein